MPCSVVEKPDAATPLESVMTPSLIVPPAAVVLPPALVPAPLVLAVVEDVDDDFDELQAATPDTSIRPAATDAAILRLYMDSPNLEVSTRCRTRSLKALVI